MIEKDDQQRNVEIQLVTFYEGKEDPQITNAVEVTTLPKDEQFESVYGYSPKQFCPELKDEMNQRKAERHKVKKGKAQLATTVEPPLSRQLFYVEALGIEDMVPKTQLPSLGNLVDKLSSSGIRHPLDETFTQISSDEWERLFNKRVETLLKQQLVETEQRYRAGSYSKGYKLKPEFELLHRMAEPNYVPLTHGEPRLAVRHQHKRGRAPKQLDMPCYLDIDGATATRMINEITAAIPIIESGGWDDVTGPLQSTGVITQLRAKYGDDREQVAGYLFKSMCLMHTVLSLALNPNSNMKLEQCFRYTDSGRWQGVGSGNLQNGRKLARKILLANHYSYDISSSTHSVMLELYEQQTGKKLPHLRQYVDTKSQVRSDLASEIGVPIAAIKGALIAAIRGAPSKGDAMTDYLGDSLDLLLNLREWKLLHSDMRKAFSQVLSTAQKTSDRKAYINASGDRKAIRLNGRKLSAAKIVSHIYTGLESVALAAMREVAQESNPILVLHDCLVTTDPVRIDDLESLILDRTGLRLKIEEEIYPDWN